MARQVPRIWNTNNANVVLVLATKLRSIWRGKVKNGPSSYLSSLTLAHAFVSGIYFTSVEKPPSQVHEDFVKVSEKSTAAIRIDRAITAELRRLWDDGSPFRVRRRDLNHGRRAEYHLEAWRSNFKV